MDTRSTPTPEVQREVIRKAKCGAEEARDVLSNFFRRDVLLHLERRMGARLARFTNAEDLVQEATARALGGIDSLPDDALFEDYRGILMQHANWTLSDRGAQAQRFLAESIVQVAGGDLTPEQADATPTTGPVTRRDEAQWLRGHVESLGEKYAAVLHLQLAGKSYAQIALELDITEENTRKRAQRALGLLQARIETERRDRET